jgi:hypothetical protein
MKTLLRSTIRVGPSDDPELFFRNFLNLSESGLGFIVPEDGRIWEFVTDFCRSHNHIPDLSTVRSHFQHRKEAEVTDRLEIVSSFPSITRGDFLKRLEEKAEERRLRVVQELLKESAVIAQTGMEVKGKKKGEDSLLRGPVDAVRYIIDRSHDIVTPTLSSRLYGEITQDGEDFLEEYNKVKADPLAGIGQFTGIRQMDESLRGAKRYELWTHAAFTGGLKSTFMLNWAYNQAVFYKSSTLIFSLEMPYNQCRRILYASHSLHEKFEDIRLKLGIQKHKGVAVGLPYQDIRDGTLHEWHPKAEEFLVEHVVPDFNDPDNNYGNIHIEVADPDKTDFSVADLRSKSELIFSKTPFQMIAVDHVGLMSPRKWVNSTTERLNEVIRDLKRMAMSFNRGQGIAVLGLFQISREGFKAAEKSGGQYNLTHLSYANEAERSSDIVTATFVNDDLRKQNRVQFQCLKSRDQKPFERFVSRVEWSCRRLYTSYDIPLVGDNSQKQAIGEEIDKMDAQLDE